MLYTFEKGIFQFFANFWVTKLKPCSGKVRQSNQNYLNQNFVIRSFLGNGFWATLSSKTNVASVWKRHFSGFFSKFLSDKVETIFWEREANHSKQFKSNLVTGTFLENGFETTLSSKRNVLSVWKVHFFSFFQIFLWRSWNYFLGKLGKAFKTI